jgi:phage N-6-adenine-methyltransferase
MKLKINPEFKSLIPELSAEEYSQLEMNILQDGIREPISVWRDTIIDGHNRFEIACKHDLDFKTEQYNFESENHVILWIIKNQLGRRNLIDYVKGKLALKSKEMIAKIAKENSIKSGKEFGKGSPILAEPIEPIDTREQLAEIAGISHGNLNKIEHIEKNAIEEIKELVLSGVLSINQADKASKLSNEMQVKIIPILKEDITVDKALEKVIQESYDQDIKNMPHISFNSGNNEWYTPKEYIDAAREVMGDIYLDPASSDIAQETVQAITYHTKETNGLECEWRGTVWLNPPYASDLIGKFIDKLCFEYTNERVEEAIVLVNNATETEWFNQLVSNASAVVFPKSRVKFYMPNGKTGAPLQGQAIIYLGDKKDKFLNVFNEFGWGAEII